MGGWDDRMEMLEFVPYLPATILSYRKEISHMRLISQQYQQLS